jgi:hypothetical protein
METSRGIVKNLDNFKGIEPLIGWDTCLYRARFMEKAYNFTAECGTVLAWSNHSKAWTWSYDFHYWLVDQDGQLYDSYYALTNISELSDPRWKFRVPKTFKYLLINSNDFNLTGSYDKPELTSIEKWATKHISKSKYDMIYVYGLGKLHNRTATEEELYDHLYNNFNDIRSATMLDTMEKQIKLILEESN